MIGSRRAIRPKDEVTAEKDAKESQKKEAEKRRDDKAKNGAPKEEVQKEEEVISDFEDEISDLDLEESLSPETVTPEEEQSIHEDTDVPEGAVDASQVIGQEEGAEDDPRSPSEQDVADGGISLGEGIDIEGTDTQDGENVPGGQEPVTEQGTSHESGTQQEPEEPTGDSGSTVAEDTQSEPETSEETSQPQGQPETDNDPVSPGNFVSTPLGVARVRNKQGNEDGSLNVTVPDPSRPGRLKKASVQPQEASAFEVLDNESFEVGSRVSTPWGEAEVIDNNPHLDLGNAPNTHDIKLRLDDGTEFHTKTAYLDKEAPVVKPLPNDTPPPPDANSQENQEVEPETVYNPETDKVDIDSADKAEVPEDTPRKRRRKNRQKRNIELTEEQQKLKQELKDLLNKPGTLNSGVDPVQAAQIVVVGVKYGKTFLEKGYLKFADWADVMLEDLGEVVEPYLKKIYGQLYNDEETPDELVDGMDDGRTVRKFDMDSLFEPEEGGDTGKVDQDKTEQDKPEKKLTTAEQLYQRFLERLKGEGYKNNHELKVELAQLLNITPGEVTQEMLKAAQETLETAVTHILRDRGLNYSEHAFNQAVELYHKLPLLNVRSSDSIERQAYSTPAPLSWLASAYARVFDSQSVLDTTAGNGALLAFAKKAIANELDHHRVMNLSHLGLNPSNLNALGNVDKITGGKQVDRVIVNPPFDKLSSPWEIDGYKVVKLDHRIAAEALGAMKDDGRAVLIVGATKEAGGMQDQERPFFNWLYSHYNVVDHFEADGSLYKRMGAQWPVRVIVINGRQASDRIAPVPGSINRLDSWKDLYERYEAFDQQEQQSDTSDPNTLGSGNGGGTSTGGSGGNGSTGKTGGQSGTEPTTGAADNQPDGAGDSGTVATGESETSGTGRPGGRSSRPGSGGGGSGTGGSSTQTDGKPELDSGGKSEAGSSKQSRETDEKTKSRPSDNDAALASEYQVPYTPRSRGFNEGILIPRNMADSLNKALEQLEQVVGDIDQFVMAELGYKTEADLHKAFMGLQVDAVAASIFNIKRGQAVIIADQTGVGKGRQAAAIQRYALRNDLTPVFVTYKPNLFTDMYDDLRDIGETGVKPFIINNGVGVKVPGAIDGEFDYLFRTSGAARTKAMQDISRTGRLPEGRNAVWLDYHQINRTGNLSQQVLNAVADRSVFILDESHNAAGAESNTGAFMRNLLANGKGALYLSATWAKRPDNVPLYFLTSMSRAVDNIDNLSEIMQTGGLPLQTTISSMLAEEGQLFRRERSFKGIEFKTQLIGANDAAETARQVKISDHVTEVLRAIVDANTAFLNFDFDQIKQEQITLHGGGASSSGNNAIEASVNAGQFTSVTHNLIGQLLYGIKLDAAVDQAIAAFKRGEKPVIVVGNTFESFHKEYVEDHGINFGERMEGFGYHLMMLRATERSRRVTVKSPLGADEAFIPPLKDLHPVTQERYQKVYELIEKNRDVLNEMAASPIDYLRYRLAQAGMRVDEITGRSLMLQYSAEGITLERREKPDKRDVVDRFNSNQLDALVGNSSMSTGLSIHASEKFSDRQVRHMIVLQADLDINQFMQMLGRINRHGQVVLPLYSLLQLNLPPEKRVAAILAMKMQSLNANTSSDTQSDSSLKNVVDMINKYGDEIARDYLLSNPDIRRALGVNTGSGDNIVPDLMKKMMNRLALQPVAVQEQVFEEIEPVYVEYIKYLDDTHQNELKPRVVDLDARVEGREVLSEGRNGDSVFDKPVVLETVNVKRQGKPPKWEEVQEVVSKTLDGRSADEHLRELLDRMDSDTAYHDKIKERIKTLRDEIEQYPEADNAEKAADLQKLETALGRYTALRNDLRNTWLPRLRIGKLAQVLVDGGIASPAVITGVNYRHTPGKGNPYATSKISIRMMVNSPVRTLTLPLSKLLAGEPGSRIYVQELTENDIDRDVVFTGENLGGDRETRYIITENLMQGIVETRKHGLVISYSTSEGQTRQGYLLPRNFDPINDVHDTVLLRGIDEVLRYITAARLMGGDALRFGLRTRLPETYIHILESGVEMAVPKGKALGRQFWGDEQLLAITGDFYSRGKTMRVTVPEQKVRDALERFMQIEPLYVKRDLKQQLLGDGNGPRFSRSQSRGSVKGRMKAHRVKQAVADIAVNVKARVRVVQSETELPAHVLAKAGEHTDGADGIKGVFDPPSKGAEGSGRNGTIWLVADHIANPAEARRKFAHEVAHAGLRRMMKDSRSLDRLLKQIGRDIPKADLETIAKIYELDLSKPEDYLEAVEEAIAHYAESVENMPWLRKAWSKLRRWARKMFPNLRWTKNDIKELILASRKAAQKPVHEQLATRPLMAYKGDSSKRSVFARSGQNSQGPAINLDDSEAVNGASYSDKLFRLPFRYGLGGINEQNEWTPADWMKKTGNGALAVTGLKKLGGYVGGGRNAPKDSLQHTLWQITEAVAWGVVDRRGTPQWLIEEDYEAKAEMSRWLRRGMNLVESMLQAGINTTEASLIHDMLSDEGVPVNDPRLKALADPIRETLEDMSQQALEFGLITEETYNRYAGAWLHRSYLHHENADLGWLQNKIKKRLDVRRKKLQGQALKGRGIFWPETLGRLAKHFNDDAHKWLAERIKDNPELQGEQFLILDKLSQNGKVSRRVYWPLDVNVPAEYQAYSNRGTFEVRGKKKFGGKQKLILWRDYTRPEREQMGQIFDARYVVARAFHTMANDLGTGRLYKNIAEHPEGAVDPKAMTPEERKNFHDDFVVIAAHKIPHRFNTFDLVGADWVEVPKTKLDNSATPKWGKLAGLYVRPEVWRDLNEMVDMQRPAWWRSLMSQWKQNKTTRSLKTHFRNFITNFAMMDLADIRFSDFRGAWLSYFAEDESYQVARDNGVIKSNNLSYEMRTSYLEPLLREVQKQNRAGSNDQENMLGFLGRMQRTLWDGVKKTDEAARELYQFEDDIFRFAAYRRRLELGDTQGEAVAYARDQFINYDIRAPWINGLRNSLIPFLGYSYRLVPNVANAMYKRPWKYAKWLTYSYAAIFIAYALDDDGDEDEEYRALPEHLQGNLSLFQIPFTDIGIRKAIRTPFRDYNDNPKFLEISRMMPGGDIFDTGLSNSVLPLPEFLQFGGIIMTISELVANNAAMTDQPIVDKLTDTDAEKVGKIAQHIYRSWMPNGPYVPFTYDFNKVRRSLEDEDGRKGASITGKPYDFWTEFANSLGISFRGRNLADDKALQVILNQRAQREINQAKNKLLTEYRNGTIKSREKMEEALQRLIRHEERLAEKVKEQQGE